MHRSLSEREQAIVFVASLIVAIAVLYAAIQSVQPAPVQASLVRGVHLEIEGSGWTIRYDPLATMNNTAFSLLIEASYALGFSVQSIPFQMPQGMFVTAINGTANGEGGRYWQYWVNGVFEHIASDRLALHDGDVVVWGFDVSREA